MNPFDRFVLPYPSLFSRGSERPADIIGSVENVVEDGHLTIKTMMVGHDMIMLDAYRGSGLVDPMHVHEDHESFGYLLSGRLRLIIDGKEFIAGPGDAWRHPRGVPHMSEALEECRQIEVKSPPRKTWYTQTEYAARANNMAE